MKALTVLQPWAAKIANGEKLVENRTWSTAYRGRMAIHAGSGTKYLDRKSLESYVTGAVIAVCDLVGCVHVDSIQTMLAPSTANLRVCHGTAFTWRSLASHAHVEGPYCWILANIQKIAPVRVAGKQGLWEFDYDKKIDVEIIDICPGCDGLYYVGPSECDCGFSGSYRKAELRRIN